VTGRFADHYRWLQGMLLGGADKAPTGDVAAAFAVAERFRARSLLDTLDAAGATALLAPAGPDVESRAEVLEEIGAVRSRLARGGLANDETEGLLARLAALEERETGLREAIAASDERFARVRGTSPSTLVEVQDALHANQAMISFVIEKRVPEKAAVGGSWALVITRDDAVAVRLADIEGLGRMIRLYVSLLGRRDGMEAEGAARLYDYLFRGVVEALPDDVASLIVLPDGPLYRVPFGALVDGSTGRFLAERFDVAVVPSAATWLRWKGGSGAHPRGWLLGFADPSPIASPAGEEHADLVPLPHARREVEGVLRRLRIPGRILEGEQATETALEQEDLSRYGVLHFAAHTLVNSRHPERSAVLLGSDAGANGNDGALGFREVVGLALDGQVVVLSACRSASGPLIGGEGVIGLANAFFQAGARTVVASLWPVRDRETAALMNRFATHLGDGLDVTAALARARRDLVRRGAPPASWAGMAVLGDGDLVLVPRSGAGSTVLLLAICIAAGLAVGTTLSSLGAGRRRSG
jgi:CHAT domain-containing protein